MRSGFIENIDKGIKNILLGGAKIDIPNKDNVNIVLIKSDRCPYCRDFYPTWEELKKKYKNNSNTTFEIVEFDENKDKLKTYNNDVNSIPTLIKENKKKYVKFEGERNMDKLSKFIDKPM